MIQSAIGAIISPSKAESRPVPLGSVPLNYYTQGKSSQRSGEKAAKSSGSGGTSFGPFKLGKTIGQGEFGKVKLGFHIENGNQVAIKFVKKLSVDSPSRREKLVREIEILQSISHPFIVELEQVIETEAYIGLIMEYASGGELFEYILSREYLSEKESARLFAQLIDGVSYLHVNGIIHRDLKLENILLDRFRNLKITDFGFANILGEDSSGMLHTSCGSPCYAAPELVSNEEYIGELADIWSCGVILYAMLCGTLPFDDDPNNVDSENLVILYKYIMETKLTFPVPLTEDAMHLVGRILNTDPLKRAQIAEIKTHRWLKSYTKTFKTYQKTKSPLAQELPILPSAPIDIPFKFASVDQMQNSSSPTSQPPHLAQEPFSVQTPITQTDDKVKHTVLTVPDSVKPSSIEDQDAKPVIPKIDSKGPIDADDSFHLETYDAIPTPPGEVEENVAIHNSPVPDITHQRNSDIPLCLPTIEAVKGELNSLIKESLVFEEEKGDDVGNLSKKTSYSSITSSRRLNRKSTLSLVDAKNSQDSIFSSQNKELPVIVDELLDDDTHDNIVKIDHCVSGDLQNPQDLESTTSSIVTPKKVSFPKDEDEIKTSDDRDPSLKFKNSSRPRFSLNISQPVQSDFQKQAKRFQSLDAPRDTASTPSAFPLKLGYHSGPIDQRAITIFHPYIILEKIQLVLLGMGLSFSLADDNPFKLIVVKSPQSLVAGTTNRFSSRVNMAPNFFTSLFQKIRYISLFGLQYNRGYDGKPFMPPVRNQNRINDVYVKFHIVVHRIRNINGIFIVDVKRHKGDIWEFKRLYNEIIVKLDLKNYFS